MGLVANALQEVESLRIARQDQRLRTTRHEYLLPLLGQANDGDLAPQAVFLQHLQGGVQLPLPTINDDQIGHDSPGVFAGFPARRFTDSLRRSPEAPAQHFLHHGVIIRPLYRANPEAPVVALAGHTFDKHYHAACGRRSLDVGDVVAFDASGCLLQAQVLLQFSQSLHAPARIHHPLGSQAGQSLGGVLGSHLH